jgi:hypothetical protein
VAEAGATLSGSARRVIAYSRFHLLLLNISPSGMGKSIIEVQQVSPAAIELIPFGDGNNCQMMHS